MEPVRCEYCFRQFIPKNGRSRYCCAEHQRQAYKERLRKSRTRRTPGHIIGNGCHLHPDCESCPFPDCVASPVDILAHNKKEAKNALADHLDPA